MVVIIVFFCTKKSSQKKDECMDNLQKHPHNFLIFWKILATWKLFNKNE